MDLARSDKIKAGLQRSFQSGKSAKASIVCYGYKVDPRGKLQISSSEAAHVRYIFERFAAGDSLGKISDTLFLMDIPSPTGKEIWSKETISKILKNEKYIGNVILGKTQTNDGIQIKVIDSDSQILMERHHPAIISKELFESVQHERKQRRSSHVR